jgi:hypothetical protein
MEGHDLATIDIPGAFMQAETDDLVRFCLDGKMAKLMVKIDPKLYRKHMQIKKENQVLCIERKKALHGTLRAALLFWQRLSEQLKEWGFKINPYDWCVANETINGKQCTILWHVDDIQISHVDANVETNIIGQLESEFRKEVPLTIRRGKIHDYLGMKIDYSVPGKVPFSIIEGM